MTKSRVVKEVALWIITLFLALVCLRSGWLKVTGNIFWVRDFHRWGYPDWFRMVIGIAELTSLVLLLVPRFAGYGASLFAAVMLGGLGSAIGPLVAGVVIGVSEAVTMAFASPSWAPIVSFTLLILLLLLRPERS